MLTCAAWQDLPDLRHGFLDAAACRGVEDWASVVAPLTGGGRPVVTLRQVHGNGVVTAEECLGAIPKPEADAVVTGMRGIAVGVVTADCVPVLLLARRTRVVAAVHAGWRGTAAGVIEAALAHLHARFGVAPPALEACLGPAIGPCCYRVGPEVQLAFTRRTGDTTAAAWSQVRGALSLDLRHAIRSLLAAAGVRGIETVGPCTACDSAFCSYRRDGQGAGRQLSFIAWV